MTTTRRRPLSQEEIEALIELRVAELRVLAAQAAVDYRREREHERDEVHSPVAAGLPPGDEGAIDRDRGGGPF